MVPLQCRNGILAAIVFAVAGCFCTSSFGNPQGAAVRHGDVRFNRNGDVLRIIQQGNRGIIDWNSFSIDRGETTRFVHDNSRAATLNRVTGSGVSRIDGRLLANGQVYLLNSNGIVIGRDGTIDVGAFTASTLDLSDGQFLNGGDLVYSGNSQAAIVNLGSISAAEGDIFLIASQVKNDGILRAENGTVGLAAGNDVLIKESGSERVFVRGASGGQKNVGVENTGAIEANIAELKAHGGNVYGMAVKNEGRVAATGVTREGGQIFLRAGGQPSAGGGKIRSTGVLRATPVSAESKARVVVDSGEGGSTEIGGTVEASGGGDIFIFGQTINVFESSVILADGEAGGGRIFIGGGRRGEDPSFMNATDVTIGNGALIDASATATGDGGEIVVFASRDLNFQGHAAARGGALGGDGGFVELSGKETVRLPGLVESVDVSAPNGMGGTLLLDPNDIEIAHAIVVGFTGSPVSDNLLYDDDISDFLQNVGSLLIETDIAGTGGNGDITMNTGAAVSWSTNNSLSIEALRNFVMEEGASIMNSGGGSIKLSGGEMVKIGSAGGAPVDAPAISVSTGEISIMNDSANPASKGVQIYNSSLNAGAGNIIIQGDNKMGVGPGVLLEDVGIGTSSGFIDINGQSQVGNGIDIVRTTFASETGDIKLTGRALDPTNTHHGIYLHDGMSPATTSQFNTGSDATVYLKGLGSGNGGQAVLFTDPGVVPAGGYVNGDDSQNVIFESLGGDITARYVQGDFVRFIDPDGIGQNFTLLDSDIRFFTAVNVGSVNIVNTGGLEIGDIKLATTADFTSEMGSLYVSGTVDAGQSASFHVGSNYYSYIDLFGPLISPQINLDGGTAGADVFTGGTFHLNGVNFNNIYNVYGSGEGTNAVVAGDENTIIDVFTDSFSYGETGFAEVNFLSVAPKVSSYSGPTVFSINGVSFHGYDSFSGGKGDDTFRINLDPGAYYDGVLHGGQGDDKFVVMPGGTVAKIDGDAGIDTLDFGHFSDAVFADFGVNKATQIDNVRGMERVIGGDNSGDTLRGTQGDDVFRINSQNSGKLNNGFFTGFEILDGLGGRDQFIFSNQATVGSVIGGSGFDRLIIDDRNLGGTNTYFVGLDSISRNPTYNFSQMEVLQLLLGPGNDTVVTRGNGMIQIFDGGAGYDTFDGGPDVFLQPDPFVLGGSTILASNFENPYAPGGEEGGDNEAILTSQTNNVPRPNPFTNPGGNSFDQYTNNFDPSIVLNDGGGGGGGNAFSASVSTVVNQAVAIMIDGSQYLLGAPAALDGSSGVPPVPIIELLRGELTPEVWLELAAAIEYEGSMIMLYSDGPFAIDLTGVPPADVIAILQKNLLADAAQELSGALELTLVIPITSMDGAVGIVAVPIVIDPQVIAELNALLGDAAFNELAGALDGN